MRLLPGKAIVASAVVAVAALATFAGMGLVNASGGAQTAAANVCRGVVSAGDLLERAAGMDGISDELASTLSGYAAQLDEVEKLQASGDAEAAAELMRQVHDGVSDLRDRLEGENNALHGALAQVVQNLRRCLGVVVPEPTPRPLPASRLVYSTKFVCGTHDSLYPFASDLDAAIDLRHRESYSTHVNIHNYGGAPVTFAGQAVQARQIGGTDGKSSEVRRIVMEPGEAVNVDCRDIRQMLYPVTPHEVCVGKTEAIDLLTRLVNSNTDFAYVEQTKLTIEMIEKAVRLEQAGELEEALRLEREIVARLDRLINAVSEETPDSDRVLQTLQDARDLMRRCAVSLAEELGIETDAALDSDALVRPVRFEGFLSITTPAELEVTAVYRAVSVGAASGISIDVEQIQPHRTRAVSAQ